MHQNQNDSTSLDSLLHFRNFFVVGRPTFLEMSLPRSKHTAICRKSTGVPEGFLRGFKALQGVPVDI